MESRKIKAKNTKIDLAPSSKCGIRKDGTSSLNIKERKTLDGMIDRVETASTELHSIKKNTVWERGITKKVDVSDTKTGKDDRLILKRNRMRLEYENRPHPCPARKRLVIGFMLVLLTFEAFAYAHLTIQQCQPSQIEATIDGNEEDDTQKDDNHIR